MKRLIVFAIGFILIANSCKKDNECYSCHVKANGNDTTICDKSKSELDNLQGSVLQGGCVKY